MPTTSCLADELLRRLADGETVSFDSRDHLDLCPECRARLEQFSDDATLSSKEASAGSKPEMIGPYIIVNLLSEGGQGAVYRAFHKDLQGDVAIKLAHARLVDGVSERNRLLKEGRVMAEMRHENLIKVHDVGVHEGRPWLAMELVRGCSLAQRTDQLKGTPKEAAATLAAIAKAVAYLHDRGIVHQDIKPANILIDEKRNPRLIDFGMARLRDIWSENADGTFGGTPEYMAPEQARGDVDRIGPAADVFGLGGVLYHLLTGRVPNEGETRSKVLERARQGFANREALEAPGIPNRLRRACQRALAADPDQRPSAVELAAELDRYTRRVSRRVALASALFIPIAAAGGWWFSPRKKAAVNPLQAGSKWAGTFYWTSDPKETRHKVQLKITDQQGDEFEGLYETRDDTGSYAFRAKGSVHAEAVQWHFIEQLAGIPRANVIEQARVEGTINGNNDVFVHFIEGADQAIMTMRKVNK
ncbi:serine/threonine-protein kinase [Tundrisphaera lichenicola]|uniref:serine/threonine-protein kinase n=1 Tax=Tundrisphaera lichenicola TaxID=2029860 RepID=UPI003EBE41CD